MQSTVSVSARELAAQLIASRRRSTQITADLEGEQLLGPKLAIVNPPLWELGHVPWFQEYWCLRRQSSGVVLPSILCDADALYDSAKVAHDSRWTLPLPSLAETRAYQAAVLERVGERLEREPDNAGLHYFVQLASYHEDMHSEAFLYTRQTLAGADPFISVGRPPESASIAGGDMDIEFTGGEFQLGAVTGAGFVFDNEKWAHPVRLAPFRMARFAVTNRQYLDFVENKGYSRPEFWDDEGRRWLQSSKLQAPRYWMRVESRWQVRRYDRTLALAEEQPVIHVNWHEAQAYCRYAGRRLPTEAEWEYAASFEDHGEKRNYPWGETVPDADKANLETEGTVDVTDCEGGDSAHGCRQMLGNVWEWTASTFDAYPGFIVDPYQEYSQPWFGTHKVLRGGSFATTRRLIRNTWRNFYTPDRGDVFAGFRTCSIRD